MVDARNVEQNSSASELFDNRKEQEDETALAPKKLLTVEELAERLNGSKSWVYKRTAWLATCWMGREPRFDWDEVIAKLKRNGHGCLA
jgi:hypothetical protein